MFGNESEGGGGRCHLHMQIVWEAPRWRRYPWEKGEMGKCEEGGKRWDGDTVGAPFGKVDKDKGEGI